MSATDVAAYLPHVINARLRRVLQASGLSQRDLAERLDCSPAYISRTLSPPGENITLDTLVRFAGALDHDVEIRLVRR